MGEENIKVDPAHLKGFNEGYIFAKYLPELSEELSKATKDSKSPRTLGFKEGREQYLAEKIKEKFPSWLKGQQRGKDDTSPTKLIDRDIEPIE